MHWCNLLSLASPPWHWLNLFWKNTKLSIRSTKANVFLHGTTNKCSKQWFDVVSDFIGCKFARHTGKIHRFSVNIITVPQLINVITFSNCLLLYVSVHVWINKPSLNRTTLPNFKNNEKCVEKTHIKLTHYVELSVIFPNIRSIAPPRK